MTRHDCTLCVYMCVTGHLSERRWVCWVVGEKRDGVTTHDNSVFCCKVIRSCVCSFTASINQARSTEKTEQETSRRRCDYRNTVPRTGEQRGTERESTVSPSSEHTETAGGCQPPGWSTPASHTHTEVSVDRQQEDASSQYEVYPSITHTHTQIHGENEAHARARKGRTARRHERRERKSTRNITSRLSWHPSKSR